MNAITDIIRHLEKMFTNKKIKKKCAAFTLIILFCKIA